MGASVPETCKEHNFRNKILCIKLESEVNYHQDARSPTYLDLHRYVNAAVGNTIYN